MPMRKVRWEDMFPDELFEEIQRNPVVYMAYGLAEPHGAYNAMGLDWLKAQSLAEMAAQSHGGVVAPPFAWHIQERPEFHDDGHGHGWLVDSGVKQSLASAIPSALFYQMALHQIRAFDARGFRAAILITGHYGGPERILRLLCDFYTRRTGSPIRLHALADWECIGLEDVQGDHAGITETSQLMALRPDLVDLDRKKVPRELGERYAAGVSFDAGEPPPSRELGERIIQSQVVSLGKIQRGLLESYESLEGWTAPTSNDADDIWHRFEQLTRKYWSPTYEEYRAGNVPEFPGWEALGEY
jgi:creatinine amidohydrolase